MNCQTKKAKKWTMYIATAMVIMAVLSVFSASAAAAGGLTMSTDYPGITAKPGDSVTFSLDFSNGAADRAVSLAVNSMPEGWDGYFSGNDQEISSVFIKSGQTEDAASFELEVPADAEEGNYEVVLTAQGGEMSSTLTLTIKVSEEELGSSSFTTEYAEQEGTSGTSFSFTSTIQNNTASEQSYSLSASAPSGWNVTFAADGTQVAAVTVPARSSQSITINVTPSENADAEEYTIPISATSASETLSDELNITITGVYDISLSTTSGVLSFDATANQQSTVPLIITNNGNVAISNLNLSSSAPTDWTVEFSQSTIETLEAGATVEVTAYVTPAQDALSGDYSLTLSVNSDDTLDSTEFRAKVKTETGWGIVGILVILIAAAGLYFMFRKFGRR